MKLRIKKKYLERFLMVMAFIMVGSSFLFASFGFQYASDNAALWGACVALLSGVVGHSRMISDLRERVFDLEDKK